MFLIAKSKDHVLRLECGAIAAFSFSVRSGQEDLYLIPCAR